MVRRRSLLGVVRKFPPLFFLGLRFLAIALLLIPFVRTPTRQEFGPIAVISVFLGGLNFGLFYVGIGLGSGSMSAVAYQLTAPFTVLLAWPLLAERPSLITFAGVVLAFGGVVVLAAGPGLSANALPILLVVGGSLCVRGRQRLDQAPRPLRSLDVDGVVVTFHGTAGYVDVAVL